MANLTDNSLQIYKAGTSDIPLLTTHHCMMFTEIWKNKGQQIASSQLNSLGEAYTQKLQKQIPAGVCTAWLIKQDDETAASGAVTICSFVPTPTDLSHNLAYFHSVYTENKFRERGCAKLLVEQAVQHCQSIGLKRLLLTASEAGRPIYSKIGFEPAADLMRLVIT